MLLIQGYIIYSIYRIYLQRKFSYKEEYSQKGNLSLLIIYNMLEQALRTWIHPYINFTIF